MSAKNEIIVQTSRAYYLLDLKMNRNGPIQSHICPHMMHNLNIMVPKMCF